MIIALIFGIVLFLVILSLKSFSYTTHIGSGISEIRKVSIGGIDQSILIRGKMVSNPVMLYLHGGP
ncbi:MAG: hypothetical protein JW795_08425, partial [Chitinivibrionales bacterium]|nr:hypothetical protein [Chitinivibrionales bacterium]